MQIFRELKLSRLVLAIVITLLIAETGPYSSLADGFLKNSLGLTQGESATAFSSDTTVANIN